MLSPPSWISHAVAGQRRGERTTLGLRGLRRGRRRLLVRSRGVAADFGLSLLTLRAPRRLQAFALSALEAIVWLTRHCGPGRLDVSGQILG